MQVNTPGAGYSVAGSGGEAVESAVSAVAWGAVFGGAVAAAGASLILFSLGAGIGLSSVSPWPGASASATAFGVGAAVWLVITQWVSSGLGGYVTGRLRTRWVGVHTHEVAFRDTANGLITWALATVIGAALLASAATGIAGAGARLAGNVAGSAASGLAANAPTGYLTDMLFRPQQQPPAQPQAAEEQRNEAARIIANAATTGDLPAADRTRLAQIVAARTGLAQADAEHRVDDIAARLKDAATKARAAADAARKTTRDLAIFMALSLLIGAFIASAAAAYGGAQRDENASLR